MRERENLCHNSTFCGHAQDVIAPSVICVWVCRSVCVWVSVRIFRQVAWFMRQAINACFKSSRCLQHSNNNPLRLAGPIAQHAWRSIYRLMTANNDRQPPNHSSPPIRPPPSVIVAIFWIEVASILGLFGLKFSAHLVWFMRRRLETSLGSGICCGCGWFLEASEPRSGQCWTWCWDL